MNQSILGYLFDGSHWSGAEGFPTRIAEHLQYTLIAVVIALVIGLPLGLLIGHTGKGAFAVAGSVNALRALPTLGLLYFFVVLISPHIYGKGDAAYLIPSEIVLTLLAIPPILSNTYAGVQSVDPAARDAAKGMGMTGSQVLWKVEVPNALPLMISGLRNSLLQVIATATITAFVSLGGLGVFVNDGLQQHNYSEMAAGAIVIAVLAIVVDLLMSLVQRVVVSPGISGRGSRRERQPDEPSSPVVDNAVEASVREAQVAGV